MAMSSGTKPSAYSSVLTGLSKELYDKKLAEGIYLPEARQSYVVGDDTYLENETYWHERVFKAKLSSWCDADAAIAHIVSNMEVKGVQVNLSGGSGAGSCAGSFVHAPGPTGISLTGTVSQSNDGTGRVA